MFDIGFQELLVLGMIALLLFGKKLPEVSRTWGLRYREFRKGLSDMQSSFTHDSYTSSTPTSYSSHAETTSAENEDYDSYNDYAEPTAPKFELPPADVASTKQGEASRDELPPPISE